MLSADVAKRAGRTPITPGQRTPLPRDALRARRTLCIGQKEMPPAPGIEEPLDGLGRPGATGAFPPQKKPGGCLQSFHEKGTRKVLGIESLRDGSSHGALPLLRLSDRRYFVHTEPISGLDWLNPDLRLIIMGCHNPARSTQININQSFSVVVFMLRNKRHAFPAAWTMRKIGVLNPCRKPTNFRPFLIIKLFPTFLP